MDSSGFFRRHYGDGHCDQPGHLAAATPKFSRISLTASGWSPRPERLSKTAIRQTHREVVGIFQKSDKADVDAAVEAAKSAFAKWRLVPAPRRAEIVFRPLKCCWSVKKNMPAT